MVYLFCGLFGTALIAMVVPALVSQGTTPWSLPFIEETEWGISLQRKEGSDPGQHPGPRLRVQLRQAVREEDHRTVRAPT